MNNMSRESPVRASFIFAVSDNLSAMNVTRMRDEASGFGFDIKQTGLLQLSARRTTMVFSRTTAESLERCSSTRPGSATT